jgi:hypothetical protein
MSALDRFFANREHLQIKFSEFMKDPAGEVQRLIAYLDITPEAEKIASASCNPGRTAKLRWNAAPRVHWKKN